MPQFISPERLMVGESVGGATGAGLLATDANGLLLDPTATQVGTVNIANGAVTIPKLATLADQGVIGRGADGSGAAELLSPSANGQLLKRTGGVVAFSALDSTDWAPLLAAQNSFSDLQTFAAAKGARFTPGAAPGTPVEGQLWYDSTKHCLCCYDGTAIRPIEESGTWTPAITFATPGDLSVAYSTQIGRYWKTGKRLIIEFQVTTSTWTFTTASGAFNINGLPYTIGTAGGPTGVLWMSAYAGIIGGTSNGPFFLKGSPNTSSILLQRQTSGSTAAATVLTTYQVASFASGTQVTVAGLGVIGLVNES